MRQEFRSTAQPLTFSLGNSLTNLICVPINDDGGEKVESRHSVMLTLGGSISDFTLTSDPQRIL